MATKMTAAEKALAAEALKMTASDFFTDVFTDGWLKMTVDEQVAFRNRLNAFVGAANKLRSRFDGRVWTGQEDGTVDVRVESIRAKRSEDSDKPGRKVAPKSMEDILLG